MHANLAARLKVCKTVINGKLMFMDISEAFDPLKQDLLIAKLGTYGFQQDALSFMKSNLRGQ